MSETRPSSTASGLYIVATPIGNMGDITRRAIETLKAADLIACEDTRVTSKLLLAHLIKKPLIPYHEHNGERQRPRILEELALGKVVVLVSDAGTPLISDPGYKLVEDAQNQGYSVFGIPGPCAAITALSIAGLPTNKFTFLGFPPTKSGARKNWFEAEKRNSGTLVYYESAKRLTDSLSDARSVLGDRQAAVCRELTKKFEEVRRDNLSALIDYYATHGNPKGEIVIVMAPNDQTSDEQTSAIDIDTTLTLALEHMSVKSAAKFAADLLGVNKKELYNRALHLSGKKP
ncbi:ribosomal RNA small subunit methyltransferase I [Kordiimonas sediminis]|uniref:Ribosomal RNA small subunit methyltransferase I n=1 Tax=Kordiimonas sediminis TaxID=1735581 RepID=A0A919ALG5_9PROT|nr:16S rRNA (cytidine(1402)-2'-O)-methyltransferase [Kordiimonas sediminis]GHF15613.1 ribosomal RNA small subunit methyltransferase I [Kordiimonas sediminis]